MENNTEPCQLRSEHNSSQSQEKGWVGGKNIEYFNEYFNISDLRLSLLMSLMNCGEKLSMANWNLKQLFVTRIKQNQCGNCRIFYENIKLYLNFFYQTHLHRRTQPSISFFILIAIFKFLEQEQVHSKLFCFLFT